MNRGDGSRPPFCTCMYRLNCARRTSWGWWDDWDDSALKTQNLKFEPWRSEAEHATSRSRGLPTMFTSERGKEYFVSLKLECQSGVQTRDFRLFPGKHVALTTAPWPCPITTSNSRQNVRCRAYPNNCDTWSDVDIMLDHRLRRRPNIKSTSEQRLVLFGYILLLARIIRVATAARDSCHWPINMPFWANAGSRVGQCVMRWTSIEPELIRRVAFLGDYLVNHGSNLVQWLAILPNGSFSITWLINIFIVYSMWTHFVGRLEEPSQQHKILTHCWVNVGPPSATPAQHWPNNGPMSRFAWI